MSLDSYEQPGTSVWRQLWDRTAPVYVRVAFTIISGVLISALTLAAVWLVALSYFQWGRSRFHIRDEWVALGFIPAGGLWCVVLARVWGGYGRRQHFITAGIWSAVIAVIVGSLAFVIEELVRVEEEMLIAAVVLAGIATVFTLFLNATHKSRAGRPFLTVDKRVNVACPECGYSLIGMTELRCPECGSTFTIDELFRRQEFAPSRPNEFPAGAAGDPPDALSDPLPASRGD
jgi:DNA-directed RNA polymerase subunit RPC12/RpoP